MTLRDAPAGGASGAAPACGPPLPRAIAVVGPTGSGKTALAVRLAERLGGEIVGTDSLQVYRGLDIGTAKPSAEERARAAHHLIDMVAPDEPFSAGAYVDAALPVLRRLAAERKPAILCGGTGLYFRALTQGLAPVPPVPPDVRRQVTARAARDGTPVLHAELARLDPAAAARLHPNDTARVSRALEVVLATGVPLSRYREAEAAPPPLGAVLHIGLDWERAELYGRLERRTVDMLRRGWIEEVRAVLALGYAPDCKPLRAIGYREIVEHLRGGRDAGTLADEIARRTRNYAKRQLTWFRHQARVEWFPPAAPDAALERAGAYLAGAGPGARPLTRERDSL
jgi:tRNA dimethylallyltransferase